MDDVRIGGRVGQRRDVPSGDRRDVPRLVHSPRCRPDHLTGRQRPAVSQVVVKVVQDLQKVGMEGETGGGHAGQGVHRVQMVSMEDLVIPEPAGFPLGPFAGRDIGPAGVIDRQHRVGPAVDHQNRPSPEATGRPNLRDSRPDTLPRLPHPVGQRLPVRGRAGPEGPKAEGRVEPPVGPIGRRFQLPHRNRPAITRFYHNLNRSGGRNAVAFGKEPECLVG